MNQTIYKIFEEELKENDYLNELYNDDGEKDFNRWFNDLKK